VQVSGHTIFVSTNDVLPLRRVRVVQAGRDLLAGNPSRAGIAAQIEELLTREHASTVGHGPLGLAIAWQGPPSHSRVDAVCGGILDAFLASRKDGPGPLVLIIDRDVAGILGVHLASLGARRVVALDRLAVSELDYLDIGSVVPGTGAVPIVVTTPVLLTERP
jgi:ethanolamine utilization protein EutA